MPKVVTLLSLYTHTQRRYTPFLYYYSHLKTLPYFPSTTHTQKKITTSDITLLADPVTGALTTSHDHGWLDELLVRHEVVVGLLGWVSGLTLLVLLTLLLTWFSDDLLLRILTESQRRQKQIEEQTPREFFLFPKLSSGRGSMDRLNRPLHHPTGVFNVLTSRY